MNTTLVYNNLSFLLQKCCNVYQKNVYKMSIFSVLEISIFSVLEPCEEQNCEYLCIITRESIAKCYCPDGFKLDVNGRNCTRKYDVINQTRLVIILDSTRFKGQIVDTHNYLYNITTFSHTNFQKKIKSDKIFRK